MLGAGLLWLGWYGFNVGSIVFWSGSGRNPWDAIGKCGGNANCATITQFTHETGVTFLNTTIATMAAMLAGDRAACTARPPRSAPRPASSPGWSRSPRPAGRSTRALALGAIADAVCAVAIGVKYKMGLDDSLDVVGVHLTGGTIGALLIGLFGTTKSPQGIDGLLPSGGGGMFYGGNATLLWHSVLGVLFTVWCGVLTTIIGLVIKYTIGWRVTPEAEVEGIDFDQHGESA